MRDAASAIVFAALVSLPPCLAAQESTGSSAGSQRPDVAPIVDLIGQAKTQCGAKQFEAARVSVAQALAACRALPGFEERSDVRELLWNELARAAYRAGDPRTAHDATEHVLRYRERTLPDAHADLQAARAKLAFLKKATGDLRGALALQEKVLEVCAQNLPDDHADLQDARSDLAGTRYALGDVDGARELQEKVCAILAATLSDDHPDLQRARVNLASLRQALGDWSGALELQESVHACQSRSLAADDPVLLTTRANLAATRYELGDLRGALELQESVFAVLSRTLPEDHRDLQVARINLAMTKGKLHDWHGALALQEKAYAVLSRALPDDHPELQVARSSLGRTKYRIGDLRGALVLFESVCAAQSRTLPDDHPLLQTARAQLATVKERLGDLHGALALKQKVYAVRSRTLPAEHPDSQAACLALGTVRYALGDAEGARALFEAVHAVRSRTLPDDHDSLQFVRLNLAVTRRELGDLEGALALFEKVYEVWSRALPDDHHELQGVRRRLAWTHAGLGSVDRSVSLAVECGAAVRRGLAAAAIAPRLIGAMAEQERPALSLILTLAQGYGGLDAQPSLARDALIVSQTLRGAETRAAARAWRARATDAAAARRIEMALRQAIDEIGTIAGEAIAGDGEQRAAALRARDARLSRALVDKERLQRALVELAARSGGVDAAAITVEDLAAALPPRSAAAAVVGYTHHRPDVENRGRAITEPRLMAIVLRRTGDVALCPLGARAVMEQRVADLRLQVGAGRDRGLSAVGDDPLAVPKALRRLVVDPILAAAGDVDTLWLSVEGALELAPLDALPLEDGEPVGTRIAMRPLVSLLDLVGTAAAAVGDEPGLLAIGGLDYDEPGAGALAIVGDSLVPPPADLRDGRPLRFRELLDAATEVRTIAQTFGEAFPGGRARVLRKDEAGKAVVVDAAPRATFVHLATHGYFVPETVRSTAEIDDADGLGLEQTVSGLSPLLLCGLALSGANLGADELGRHAGILTAEEILALDLSRCHLVTLSACDTSLGVSRAGQGYASLRAALQGAGARYVLTSLWKVGDEVTMELMVEFYRRLWESGQDPHQALWEAKMQARRRGAAFRDWAGWVLTGR